MFVMKMSSLVQQFCNEAEAITSEHLRALGKLCFKNQSPECWRHLSEDNWDDVSQALLADLCMGIVQAVGSRVFKALKESVGEKLLALAARCRKVAQEVAKTCLLCWLSELEQSFHDNRSASTIAVLRHMIFLAGTLMKACTEKNTRYWRCRKTNPQMPKESKLDSVPSSTNFTNAVIKITSGLIQKRANAMSLCMHDDKDVPALVRNSLLPDNAASDIAKLIAVDLPTDAQTENFVVSY